MFPKSHHNLYLEQRFLKNFIIIRHKTVAVKLHIPPSEAKTAVFIISSLFMFTKIVKSAPNAVLIFIELSTTSLVSWLFCLFLFTWLLAFLLFAFCLLPFSFLLGSCIFAYSSSYTAAWLTADAMPPATARYPAILTINAGSPISADKTTLPAAVSPSPIFRKRLKNFGVGSFSRSIKFAFIALSLSLKSHLFWLPAAEKPSFSPSRWQRGIVVPRLHQQVQKPALCSRAVPLRHYLQDETK
ncbi:hypothetical protein SAMN05443429_11110 [Cruoricaptor ignavus]|uniref:Uncharacterized protein n=1 Tax=Cruoricaptor ignavus TaxID=1118202 RepID=A0A1M6H393_9FLAO|nr:hypothetical protein SAMN05443429_11110 [Cruoricaptor ignavus]